MAYINYNANPLGKRVGDCVIRAISKVTDQDWQTTYSGLALQGYMLFDMQSANNVWASYLRKKGFRRHIVPDTCPDCYSVKDFCKDHPDGVYLLSLNKHVVAVVNGDYYDSFDCGDEPVIYYFERNEE
jgi:hypothetical protein